MGISQGVILLLIVLVHHAAPEPLLCPQDPIVDAKMRDKEFTDEIIMCVLDEAPCKGNLAHQVKRLAPDVFRGLCPPPCDACTQKQVRKAISFMQNKYPKQFADMIYRFSNGRK